MTYGCISAKFGSTEAMLDALLQCYLEAYQLEKKAIEESDINGIVAQGCYHWDNHWHYHFLEVKSGFCEFPGGIGLPEFA